MTIKVLDKAVQIIELLAKSNTGVRLKDVIEALRFNKTTALRILRSLESHHLAARDGAGCFVLGSRILSWHNCHRRNFELLAVVRPVLEKVRDKTSETVTFSILMGGKSVVIDQVVSPHVTSTRFELGSSAPLNAGASGRVILAYLEPEKRENFLSRARLERLTERTITNKLTLERQLKRCRMKGYAVSKEERFSNTGSVAAPIFNSRGEVLGVVSVIGPSDRLKNATCKSITKILLRETRLLTAQIIRVSTDSQDVALTQ